jgi:hypothetical protein
MSQKGGTYRATPGICPNHCHHVFLVPNWPDIVATQSTSTTESRVQTESKIDNQPWEVVNHPEPEKEGQPSSSHSCNRMSSHFDFTVRWKQREYTLFSYDFHIRSHKKCRALQQEEEKEETKEKTEQE